MSECCVAGQLTLTGLQIGYHVGMLDTDAVILRDLHEFYHGAMSNVSDVMVSSDCVAPFADGNPVRPGCAPEQKAKNLTRACARR